MTFPHDNRRSIDTTPWLADPELTRLFDALEAIGETRFIGGAVRDAVLGLPHSDIDLATPALPEAVMAAAKAAGFKTVPTGLDHGTVAIILPRGPIEITTLRSDVATDGRHAEIAHTGDWRIDAARRDFTINALSADRRGEVYDYFGGLDDLAARRVRFIGDAANRIREDYLRILRFFRFSARYAGALDRPALAAIHANTGGLARLSGERILSEALKLLANPASPAMWQAMIECGVVDAILPAARDVKRLKRVIDLERTLPSLSSRGLTTGSSIGGIDRPDLAIRSRDDKAGDAFLRLMALLPSPVPDIPAIAKRLKLSTAQKKRLMQCTLPAERLDCLKTGDWAHALYGAEPMAVIDAAMLLAASGDLPRQSLKRLLKFEAMWTPPVFPLGGDNLLELGLKPGPIFGALLREVEQWWIGKDFKPNRQQCFAELKSVWFERKRVNR